MKKRKDINNRSPQSHEVMRRIERAGALFKEAREVSKGSRAKLHLAIALCYNAARRLMRGDAWDEFAESYRSIFGVDSVADKSQPIFFILLMAIGSDSKGAQGQAKRYAAKAKPFFSQNASTRDFLTAMK